MSVTPELLRKVMGHFATGITVVTTEDQDGTPYGLTVNAFTSVSLNPVLVLVCLDNELSGLDVFRRSGKFGVNILADDQEELSSYFAQTGTDRSRTVYTRGKTGVPLLEGVLARLECEISAWYPGGDHAILLGEVKYAEIVEGEKGKGPLIFFHGAYRKL